MIDVVRDIAEPNDAIAALRGRLTLGARHFDFGHVNKKPRIDPVIAGSDAFAAEYTAARPILSGFITLAVAQDVEDSRDNADRIVACFGLKARCAGDWTCLHALAAARAGIDHFVDTGLQHGFEGIRHKFGSFSR